MTTLLQWPGKSSKEGEGLYHPAVWHMLDVGACAEVLITRHPALSSLPEALQRALLVLVTLHDLGKISEAFRAMLVEGQRQAYRHWRLSDHLLRSMDGEIGRRLGGSRIVRPILYAAVAGHHGGPPDRDRSNERPMDRAIGVEARQTGPEVLDLACAAWPGGSLDGLTSSDAQHLSWLLSGLTTVADWLGSNTAWFPFRPDIEDPVAYLAEARRSARTALSESGLEGSAAAADIAPGAVIGWHALRPMQRAVADVMLPDGPTLALVEDATGSGKTEAALVLAHRMMTAGKASGLFFALPTMATSNAMFDRLSRDVAKLFATPPSLALAHGRSRFHAGFRALLGATDPEPDAPSCAEWLADDRRRSLLADVGVGTIDQALMAVLPTRFSTVRQWGLSKRILIVDEAHAYDPYMQRELGTLLHLHAMLGGSAILMTATLPQDMRERYVAAFREGLGASQPTALASDYPSLAVVGGEGVGRTASVEPAAGTIRSVDVRRLASEIEAIAYLSDAVVAGAACVWVRNAVDDAIAAVAALRDAGVEADLLHARYALVDRLRIEEAMQKRFGRDGDAEARRGRVLVSTQVVEASLDLDFDVMISDLAPIGSMIQRAGRLWRHMDLRPGTERPVQGPELAVLSPNPLDVACARWIHATLDRGAWVYPQDVLWRSAQALFGAGRIDAPGGLRDLIESVHGPDAPVVPQALLDAEMETEGRTAAERARAQHTVIDPHAGYLQSATARVFDETVFPTRLGQPQMTLVLARRTGDRLAPWADDTEPERAWSMSEVSLSKARYDRLPEPPDQDASDVASMVAAWPEWKRATHRLAVVGADGNIAEGLRYDPSHGLIVTP